MKNYFKILFSNPIEVLSKHTITQILLLVLITIISSILNAYTLAFISLFGLSLYIATLLFIWAGKQIEKLINKFKKK